MVAVNYHLFIRTPLRQISEQFHLLMVFKDVALLVHCRESLLFLAVHIFFVGIRRDSAAEMSQALTLRWVTRNHRTVNKLPCRTGDGSEKVCESVGCVILWL